MKRALETAECEDVVQIAEIRKARDPNDRLCRGTETKWVT